jgi:hypothetical protein
VQNLVAFAKTLDPAHCRNGCRNARRKRRPALFATRYSLV